MHSAMETLRAWAGTFFILMSTLNVKAPTDVMDVRLQGRQSRVKGFTGGALFSTRSRSRRSEKRMMKSSGR